MNNQLEDLFNLSASDLVQEEKRGSSNEIFKPTPEKGKEGVYSAVFRFIPWHENPKKSIMKKWTAWLVDPLSDKGRYVDCPSSVNKDSLLRTVWNKLNYSDSAADQKLAEKFSRRQQFASLIQIVQDKNAPENEGKILVYTYGVKIHEKIQEMLKPEFGDERNPFHPIEGKAFHLKIVKIGGYNNYDSSKFLENDQPILIDGKNCEKTPEGMTALMDYLKENSPELSKYDYQEWDDEITTFVQNVIRNTIPAGRQIAGLDLGDNKSQATKAGTGSTISEDVLDDDMGVTESPKNDLSDLISESSTESDDIIDLNDDDFDASLYDDI